MLLYAWTYNNGAYIRAAAIDYATSVIWVQRFNVAGEFEIYVRVTDDLLTIFKTDDVLITRDDSDAAMIVENVKLSTNVESGDFLIVSGKSAESIIGRRIIPKQTNYSGTAENAIRQMMIDNIISPVYSFRQIPLISLGTLNGWTDTIDRQVTGKNLLETISDICISYNYGFRLPFKNGDFVFELYRGIDRSYEQTTNTFVIFSPEFENLGNTEYTRDLTDYYNSVYIAGEGQGSERVIVEVDDEEKSGLQLREKWVDSRNTSSKTEGGELTPTEYAALLVEQGAEELQISKAKTTFEGEILTSNTYIYGVDYGLGDKVQIVNAYGVTGTATVTEITEVDDGEGYRCIPTLSQWQTINI